MSSQTSEVAVKISEKCSELALERAWGVYEEKGDSLSTPLSRQIMYDGTVLCCLLESQNVSKSCFFCQTLALLNIERLTF